MSERANSRFSALLWLASVALAASLLTACGASDPATSEGPRNVLLISIDTLRSDHLGTYGYDRKVSPHIDRLAESGVVFENAISTSGWTLPAHASMLTGLYPAFHALQDDGVKLPPGIGTVAEAFRDQGFRTFAVVSHVYVSRRYGLDRGFESFDDSLIAGGTTNPIAETAVDRFLEQLAREPERPFFGFLHLFDPHWPYGAPEPFGNAFTDPAYAGPVDGSLASLGPFFDRSKPMPAADLAHAIALYDGEIAYVDAQVGRLVEALEELGLRDDTAIVLTADHGEEFKEHGGLGHARTLFGDQLRVPLVLAGSPRLPAGIRRQHLASPIDLFPTLLDLAGASPPADLHGVSLLNDPGTPHRPVFSESIRFGWELRSIQIGPFKLIHYPVGDQRLHFDLRRDPHERKPSPRDPTDGALSSALAEYAATADAGWHLKVVAVTGKPLRLTGEITTTGRLIHPRRYFSEFVKPGRADFRSYEVEPSKLRFDLVASAKIGEITFDTDPPDAPVTFAIRASGPEAAGVFVGTGEAVASGEPITLERDDARLQGILASYLGNRPGLYIRTVPPARASAPASNLPDEVIEQLRALGYVDAEGGP